MDEGWMFGTLIGAIVLAFIVGIASMVEADNDYKDLCHARGGEVIIGANPRLCRDGDLLINVYKENQNGGQQQ